MQRFLWILTAICLIDERIAPANQLLAQQPAGKVVKPRAIPHAQDRPPNEPRDPATALAKMTVPDGFSVELVAAEPDISNPVAMAIDERGRFWITESFEYPRREPGPGRDVVKILEDTEGDGKADKFTVFLEGLNIPSGIAVGHGGVWIANAPDLLFVQDTDGDGRADKQEVVVTGFGRTDTHELPNSLTWGPDGWLYGLNGVFNRSHVKYAPTNPNYSENHPGWPLTCALFRIHPRTREFQVFCEGTSNPWGVAFDDHGEAFVSACVIDHLWHLTETGYYHRQGGPYPPFTWKMESIVTHKHQKAAYCGIHYFDSDSFPEAYRKRLYMGNIHGGCINVDRVEPHGASYRGFGEPDFMTANDAWFMPVVQKCGPDGSLYVLDWYDRYHCYQDANRDPAGIDRSKGRLYRIRHNGTPRVPKDFDLGRETNDQLVERLASNTDYLRDTARRLLQERNDDDVARAVGERLAALSQPESQVEFRRRLYMTLTGLSGEKADFLLKSKKLIRDPVILHWRIRAAGDRPGNSVDQDLTQLEALAHDRGDLKERLQMVIAASKLVRAAGTNVGSETVERLFRIYRDALADSQNDPVLMRTVWQNLHPFLETHADQFVHLIDAAETKNNVALMELMPRLIDRLVGRKEFDPQAISRLIGLLSVWKPETAAEGIGRLSAKVQNREVTGEHLGALRKAAETQMAQILGGSPTSPMYLPAAFLSTSWKDPKGITFVQNVFRSETYSVEQRLAALNALIAANDGQVLELVTQTFDAPTSSAPFKAQILGALSRLNDPHVAEFVLKRYSKLEPDLQVRAIELLTQRSMWAKQLLRQMGEKKIPTAVVNPNQARRLRELKDNELAELLAKNWGQSRDGRDPTREKYIADMRQLIRKTPADPYAGEKVFKKVCAQCHKIYGEGMEVGPDITLNGRNDFNQLLSNVFDPSLVIGAGYRSYTVVTNGGRALNGLLAEDSPQRVVLKVQGGKQEVISRGDIYEIQVSEISLMPEQIEKQLSPQEIADLFAFLSLDKHPSDRTARKLAGSGHVVPKESTKPAEFPELVNEILPGFTTSASGKDGVAVLKEHFGRAGVLRTHPVNNDAPCVLTGQVLVPSGAKTTLLLDVSHDANGEWELAVRANGQQLLRTEISPKKCKDGWLTLSIDLTRFAGQEVRLELRNNPDDREREFGYWGGLRLVSE